MNTLKNIENLEKVVIGGAIVAILGNIAFWGFIGLVVVKVLQHLGVL